MTDTDRLVRLTPDQIDRLRQLVPSHGTDCCAECDQDAAITAALEAAQPAPAVTRDAVRAATELIRGLLSQIAAETPAARQAEKIIEALADAAAPPAPPPPTREDVEHALHTAGVRWNRPILDLAIDHVMALITPQKLDELLDPITPEH